MEKKFALQIIGLLIVTFAGLALAANPKFLKDLGVPVNKGIGQKAQVLQNKVKVIDEAGNLRGKFIVDISDTDEKRQIGLSGRESLATDAGMLFIFDNPDKRRFWMKGMLIPIDIIWVRNNTIVDLIENVQPPSSDSRDEALELYEPIKSLREEDKEFFPKTFIELGKLARFGLPVADGLVIAPPIKEINQILTSLSITNSINYEGNKSKLSRLINNIKIPQLFLIEYKGNISTREIWKNLLNVWFKQLESKILREDNIFDLGLTGQIIIFAKEVKSFGRAYFDTKTKEVIVKMDKGILEFEEGVELDEIIVKAQKKLHFAYIFGFIIEKGRVKLVKLIPFTQKSYFESGEINKVQTLRHPDYKNHLKIRAIKAYLDIGSSIIKSEDIDGIILESKGDESLDQKLVRFTEVASYYSTKPILYKFSNIDLSEPFSFRDQLKENSDVFLFARNKKKLLNTQVILPKIGNVEQFLQIKRDLGSLGIFRKGTLKIWMQISSPKNVLELEELLSQGVDGLVLNLDDIWEGLNGGLEHSSNNFLELAKFLEIPLKITHKASVPFIATGDIVLKDEVIHFLSKLGIYGVVLENNTLDLARENLKAKELNHPNFASGLEA